MARWVKCTRKADETPVYLNLDAVMFLRWNETESFTFVLLPGGKQNTLRVLEHPDEIFGTDQQSASKAERRAASR
jgi:hypothetical protein